VGTRTAGVCRNSRDREDREEQVYEAKSDRRQRKRMSRLKGVWDETSKRENGSGKTLSLAE
jgi:hypothetical protein